MKEDTKQWIKERRALVRRQAAEIEAFEDKWDEKIAALDKPVTYSIGDRFYGTELTATDGKYILAYQSQKEKCPSVSMISLASGSQYHRRNKVKSSYGITREEFEVICDGGVFTRYFDYANHRRL